MTETEENNTPFEPFQKGDILDEQYEILLKIGSGALGIVYKARDRELNETVVVKIFHPRFNNYPDVISRFRKMIRHVRAINSPGITRIHAFRKTAEFHYLIMDYIAGKNLEALIEEAPLDYAAAVLILEKICAILTLSHTQGVIHGNLKPRNIIIAPDDSFHIIDFGFTTPDDIATFPDLFDARYMAPEQIYPVKPTAAVDLYALGIMFYQLLTGRLPFNSTTPSEIIYEHAQKPFQKPSLYNKKLHTEADLIINALLKKEVKDRIGNAELLQNILRGEKKICPSCEKSIFPAHAQCPTCSIGISSRANHPSGAVSKSERPLAKEGRDPRVELLVSLRKELTQSTFRYREMHCYQCGRSLPRGFPFCTGCFLDAPAERQAIPRTLIITKYGDGFKRSLLLRLLMKLSSPEPLPKGVKNSLKPPLILKLSDHPDRVLALREILKIYKVENKALNEDDLAERLRYNSWVPAIVSAALIPCFAFISPPYAALPAITLLALFIRNTTGIHRKSVNLRLQNLNTFFSSKVVHKVKEHLRSVSAHELLHSTYESIVFHAFNLMEMMRQEKEGDALFSEIIQSIEGFIDDAGREVEVLMTLERQFSIHAEAKLLQEKIKYESVLETPIKPDVRSGYETQLQNVLVKLKNYYEIVTQLTTHYSSLSNIITCFERMKPKINSIKLSLNRDETGSALSNRKLLTEVLDELSALEKGMVELNEDPLEKNIAELGNNPSIKGI